MAGENPLASWGAGLPIGDNPVFQGGLGLAALGAAASVARRSAGLVSAALRRHLLMTLEVTSKDAAYPWMLHWLNAQGRSTQHLSVQTGASAGFSLVPGPGRHVIVHRSRFYLVDRAREYQATNMSSGTPWEKLTLTALGRDPSCFQEILADARAMALPEEEGTTTVYTSWGTEWRPFGAPRRKRPLASVVLEDGAKEALLADLAEWHESRDWYRRRGIPYRRGYLLHGPPGSGKSSFILALAGHLGHGICMLSLSDDSLTDDRLALALSTVPKGCIVVLEDVDAAFVQRGGGGVSSVTFSGLLNCLDGVLSGEERVIFMTTNHIDRLDAALIRPGRVDLVRYLGDATDEQVARFFRTFYEDLGPPEGFEAGEVDRLADAFAAEAKGLGGGLSMAHLQGFLLRYKTDPRKAVEEASAGHLAAQVQNSQTAKPQEADAEFSGPQVRSRRGRQLSVDEVDRMMFNPQPGWEEQCGLKK